MLHLRGQVQALREEQDAKTQAVAALRATTREQLYTQDLHAFLEALQVGNTRLRP